MGSGGKIVWTVDGSKMRVGHGSGGNAVLNLGPSFSSVLGIAFWLAALR
jgi:hypothetical protein